jgi:hypothetical protein
MVWLLFRLGCAGRAVIGFDRRLAVWFFLEGFARMRHGGGGLRVGWSWVDFSEKVDILY